MTHFKCHELTGFGGAIKNLGMGCASRKGKLVQHSTVAPKVSEKYCTGCGICPRSCAHDAIAVIEGKAIIDPTSVRRLLALHHGLPGQGHQHPVERSRRSGHAQDGRICQGGADRQDRARRSTSTSSPRFRRPATATATPTPRSSTTSASAPRPIRWPSIRPAPIWSTARAATKVRPCRAAMSRAATNSAAAGRRYRGRCSWSMARRSAWGAGSMSW